ncbi:small ribosomal subunit biogenesis GTPase RsgA [Alkalimonas collagenimarina]|uniref:Small ribosomal subunit biogenesis GTPase RsgA n=1 Tax=Alkalimonas collagenimarina TaxID=400390 RepID=A0ABT9GVM6_9GAMM|nr:small ribosomal subunit biogenesis GTPase RsgA [Alkalimonas collagenimarina]MDP4535091.1 small ribosomal subunit biogenesis GTPase RsgA [Alkalimonas collagenimarina]
MSPKRRLTKQQQQRIAQQNQRRLSDADKKQAPPAEDSLYLGSEQGLILSRFGQHADVESENGDVIRCNLRRSLNSAVTGDRVVWRKARQPQGGVEGIIDAIADRQSVLLRPDFYDGLKPVAANIDRIVVVSSVLPEFSCNIIDRYLVAAEVTDIPPLLVINKADMLSDAEREVLEEQLAVYERIGYDYLWVSAHTGLGMDALKTLLRQGTSILVGQSGVGKSSMMNSILPELQLSTRDVSSVSGLGQHTTTASRLYHLPDGGQLIDSPGIREFGLWHFNPEQVTAGFIEFRDYLGHCKFRDCKHITDPGCAILQAVADGHISEIRYQSYLKILTSMAEDKPNYL